MYCGNCGAPIQPAARQVGACAYCNIALDPEPSAQPPVVDRAVAGLWEAVANAAGRASTVTTQSTSYVVDGKTYTSLDEMPPEARAKLEANLAKLEALGLLPGKR